MNMEELVGRKDVGSKRDSEDMDIETLMSDREAFNAFVYTSIQDAMAELDRRRKDPSVPDFPFIPNVLKHGSRAAMFRQVFTPNYEIRRFINITDASGLKPLFWEYHEDKFTSNNEWKHALGRLFFYGGTGKKGGAKIETLKIIDFNDANGKKISSIRTLWGQSLIDFHHEFLDQCFKKVPISYFNASTWFQENGKSADKYYKSFLSLFIQHTILFENFMLDGGEGEFTKNVFLPAFISVWQETGYKPLIVSLEPTDIEGDKFWLCYPNEDRAFVERKLAKARPQVSARKSWSLSRILSLWT